VRVRNPIGDAVAVGPTRNPAVSVEFVNCEVSTSGRNGIVVDADPTATAPWVEARGCNFFGNGVSEIVNLSAIQVRAFGNWWGDPAGPQARAAIA